MNAEQSKIRDIMIHSAGHGEDCPGNSQVISRYLRAENLTFSAGDLKRGQCEEIRSRCKVEAEAFVAGVQEEIASWSPERLREEYGKVA